MFSTKAHLIKKTGKHGVGRFSFLEQLVKEYKTTNTIESRKQVLANLANFAYDPINYDYLWRLSILDVFFEALDDSNKKIVAFAAGGLCNISLHPLSREYILRTKGYRKISSLLWKNDESSTLSALTTLMYIITPESKNEIIIPPLVKKVEELHDSTNKRIKNLAEVFLQDFCERKFEKPTLNSNTDSIVNNSTVNPVESANIATNESKFITNIKIVQKPSRIVISEENEADANPQVVKFSNHPKRRL